MIKFNVYSILFNLGGVAIFGIIAIYGLNQLFVHEELDRCSVRYETPTQLNVHNAGGGLMTPIEFQASIGRNQRNIVRNALLAPQKNIPGNAAILVRLEKGTSHSDQKDAPEGGIGFNWIPADTKGAGSACLQYSVYLEKGFDFAGGGLLPGLYGGRPLTLNDVGDGKTAWATRVIWSKDGKGGAFAQVPGAIASAGRALGVGGFKFEVSRWHRIEQEAILNTPGMEDGILRVWVDGELVVDVSNLVWRKDAKLGFTGVLADVAYGVSRGRSVAPKDTRIALTPFMVSWK